VIPPWFRLPSIESLKPGDTATIVGAGLAGCALARCLAERKVHVHLLDAGPHAGSAASGNPVGIAKPFITREPSAADDFYRAAFQCLHERLAGDGMGEAAAFHRCGVLQLTEQMYPHRNDCHPLSAVEASDYAGVSLNSPAVAFDDAGWLNPHTLCATLADHALINLQSRAEVIALHTDGSGAWQLQIRDCDTRLETRCLVLATGTALSSTPWTNSLPLTPARGQISRFTASTPTLSLRCVISGKQYAIADQQTLWSGATFDRDDTSVDVRSADHARNLHGLATLLPTLSVCENAVAGYAGVRATTPDRLPLVGAAPDISAYRQVYVDLHHGRASSHYSDGPVFSGLYLFGGFGSRGIVSTPYCAELLADYLCGAAENLQSWHALLHPARFCLRQLKRSR